MNLSSLRRMYAFQCPKQKEKKRYFLCIKHKNSVLHINSKLRCFLLNKCRYSVSSIYSDLICTYVFSTNNNISWGKSFACSVKIDRMASDRNTSDEQTLTHLYRMVRVIWEKTASIAGNNIFSCETFFKMLWFKWSDFQGKFSSKLIQCWL